MENKFEQKITKMLNEDVYIPQKITNSIKASLKKEKEGVWLNMKLNKIVATMVGIVIVGTGVVFAGKAFIDNRFNSINEAKENGYFEKVGGDYVKDAGLSIKIADYFIDTTRVGVTFDIQADEAIDGVKMYNIEENTNNPAAYDLIRFIDENGNEIPYKPFSDIGVHVGAEFGITKEQLGNNIFRTSYLQFPNEDYSKAHKMKIAIKRVITNNDGEEKEYIGNWEFEIDIADKYLNKSDNIIYNASVGGTVVGKAELSATELVVTFNCKEANEAWDANKVVTDLTPINNNGVIVPRLLGENGQEIENAFSSSEYTQIDSTRMQFNISKFSAENCYTIVLDGGMIITLTK